jgi:hypothetical protein
MTDDSNIVEFPNSKKTNNQWDGRTVAGDVFDGEAVYQVTLHREGRRQLDDHTHMIRTSIRREVSAVVTWMTLQFVIIVALLLVLIF